MSPGAPGVKLLPESININNVSAALRHEFWVCFYRTTPAPYLVVVHTSASSQEVFSPVYTFFFFLCIWFLFTMLFPRRRTNSFASVFNICTYFVKKNTTCLRDSNTGTIASLNAYVLEFTRHTFSPRRFQYLFNKLALFVFNMYLKVLYTHTWNPLA